MKTLKYLLSFFSHIERRQTKIEENFEEAIDGVTEDIVTIFDDLEEIRQLARELTESNEKMTKMLLEMLEKQSA